ncbi:hypothetical protein DFP72DRAFT_874002 [Ephemerocybe angulata]|uniref:RRM domain-containing protein n=1 Tax=Ephemerocybe angulata TaxID=980116 RepID=A0A8H6MFZ5_9AGAR|nr:hypothetical protein DFP72DRAFT_874002 [Tulosesus angulatus]
MSRRLYLGRLPADVRSEDVSKFFDGYGRIVDCRVMTGFGFVEFEEPKDAEDALHNFNGKPFMGSNMVVEFAKESRPRREVAPRSRRPPGIRIIVSGISRDTSWQDLKDFGRDAGSVSFADIDRDIAGQGILEYLSREDAERAVKDLDNKDLRGKVVRVSIDETARPSADHYRRDERRDDRDRYRDERPREDRYRRERSRSPRRDDARRARSPPPRREDDRRPVTDDYRRGYDERRPDDYYGDRERRREEPERKRDDRRRDDRDDRYEDRAARQPNGEAWAR